MMKNGHYGKELILDIFNCDITKFNRKDIQKYFEELCKVIDMEACDLHFWDDLDTPEEEKETEPHLVGTSAIQFIKTSSIVLHSLTLMKRIYINIFSCKDFDTKVAEDFTNNWFGGYVVNSLTVDRL